MPTNASKYTGGAAFIDPHYILIELTEIHHHRPSKTPSFLSRFHIKVNGRGACHINGRNYYLPEQTRSHEFVQGPHTLVGNIDLDFMKMNILLNRYSANKKTHINDLRQLKPFQREIKLRQNSLFREVKGGLPGGAVSAHLSQKKYRTANSDDNIDNHDSQ